MQQQTAPHQNAAVFARSRCKQPMQQLQHDSKYTNRRNNRRKQQQQSQQQRGSSGNFLRCRYDALSAVLLSTTLLSQLLFLALFYIVPRYPTPFAIAVFHVITSFRITYICNSHHSIHTQRISRRPIVFASVHVFLVFPLFSLVVYLVVPKLHVLHVFFP